MKCRCSTPSYNHDLEAWPQGGRLRCQLPVPGATREASTRTRHGRATTQTRFPNAPSMKRACSSSGRARSPHMPGGPQASAASRTGTGRLRLRHDCEGTEGATVATQNGATHGHQATHSRESLVFRFSASTVFCGGREMVLKVCSVCGRPHRNRGGRRDRHAVPARSGSYRRDARRVAQTTVRCAICGEGPAKATRSSATTSSRADLAAPTTPAIIKARTGLVTVVRVRRSVNARGSTSNAYHPSRVNRGRIIREHERERRHRAFCCLGGKLHSNNCGSQVPVARRSHEPLLLESRRSI